MKSHTPALAINQSSRRSRPEAQRWWAKTGKQREKCRACFFFFSQALGTARKRNVATEEIISNVLSSGPGITSLRSDRTVWVSFLPCASADLTQTRERNSACGVLPPSVFFPTDPTADINAVNEHILRHDRSWDNTPCNGATNDVGEVDKKSARWFDYIWQAAIIESDKGTNRPLSSHRCSQLVRYSYHRDGARNGGVVEYP